jgi:hypothetical protein
MFLNSSFDIVKKSTLYIFLLLPPVMPVAHASDTAERAALEDATANNDNENQQQAYSFPGWPESRSVRKERVPLAPPGPYMSSALNDFAFDRDWDNGRDNGSDRHDAWMDLSSDKVGKRFSPDIPWPSHRDDSPARWRPEDGYRYVEPETKIIETPYRRMPYLSPPNYNNYGYGRPAMNWPDNTGR